MESAQARRRWQGGSCHSEGQAHAEWHGSRLTAEEGHKAEGISERRRLHDNGEATRQAGLPREPLWLAEAGADVGRGRHEGEIREERRRTGGADGRRQVAHAGEAQEADAGLPLPRQRGGARRVHRREGHRHDSNM